jgi:hypothetical protein
MTTGSTSSTSSGLSIGSTSEFSLFFRVKPGEAELVRTALEELQKTPGYRPGSTSPARSNAR